MTFGGNTTPGKAKPKPKTKVAMWTCTCPGEGKPHVKDGVKRYKVNPSYLANCPDCGSRRDG